MSYLLEVLGVALLFIIRIGLPLVVLLIIGTLVQHAYTRQDEAAAESAPEPIKHSHRSTDRDMVAN